MDTVRMRWSANRQFVGWDEAGHSVVLDAPGIYEGEESGVRPLELVLYALAGCTGIDVISILEKKRQDVRAFEINVEAHQRTDEFPHIYTKIEMHYIVTGFGVTEAAVTRAIELSEEKYCSVQALFGPQVTVTTSFEIREAEAPRA